MTTAEITRVPLEESATLALSTEVVGDAKKLLGYNAAHVPVFGELSKALAKLGIQPLDRREVERYKRSKEYHGITNVQKVTLVFVTWLCTVVGYVILWQATNMKAGDGATFLHWMGGTAIVIISSFVFGCWQDGRRRTRVTRDWKSYPINAYNGALPVFVLNTAVTLKREIPEVGLSVERLEETVSSWTPPRATPDPFLRATLGNEDYYVEVFDESEFEKKTRRHNT